MISKEMIINDIIRRYPKTVSVFAEFGVDSCCGGAQPIEVTASEDGVDVEALVKALNRNIGEG